MKEYTKYEDIDPEILKKGGFDDVQYLSAESFNSVEVKGNETYIDGVMVLDAKVLAINDVLLSSKDPIFIPFNTKPELTGLKCVYLPEDPNYRMLLKSNLSNFIIHIEGQNETELCEILEDMSLTYPENEPVIESYFNDLIYLNRLAKNDRSQS